MNKTKDMTFPGVKKLLREMDPKLEKSDDEGWLASCILLSAAFCGTGPKAIEKFTGLPGWVVKKWQRRAREAEIFKKGRIECQWMDEKAGTVAFFCDVATVRGWLKRA